MVGADDDRCSAAAREQLMATVPTHVVESPECAVVSPQDDHVLFDHGGSEILAGFLQVSDPSRELPRLVEDLRLLAFKNSGVRIRPTRQCRRGRWIVCHVKVTGAHGQLRRSEYTALSRL